MGKCVSRESRDKIDRGVIRGIIRVHDTPHTEDEQLRSIDVSQIPDVMCSNKPVRARVTDVYDGDTATVIFLVGGEAVKMKIRINGIDTPEIRSGKGKLKIEKVAAKVCRDYLKSLIDNKIITLTIRGWDKYGGRMVGNIYVDGEDVSLYMIRKGYARPYDGGKKKEWTEQELRLIIDR